MRKGDTYTVGFAAMVCVCCSLLLAIAHAGLREQQEKMAELDRKTNVLKAFQAKLKDDQGRPLGVDAVEQLFRDRIQLVYVDPRTNQLLTEDQAPKPEEIEAGKALPLYRWTENGRVTRYAFPISGKGLWSTIYGYLALEKDLATVAGVTFYKNGETPGLGAEVATDWFQDQFKGKKVFEDGRLLPFEVVKGKVADKFPDGNDHAVDGITGATLTGRGVTQFLNADVARYEPYFKRIRGS